MSRPLDGITVLAFEHAVAAPVCTRHLADQGARVIKIERPGVGDFARAYDTRVGGMSSYFVWANRSKESLTLDLKRPEAREVLDRLLARTDVVVQNLAPGAAARLGLSIDSLRPRFPRIIVCDISGYGLDGPYRDKKAYDLMVQAEAGLLAVTGTGDAMARAGFSAADTAAGMYAYSSILAALLLRARTGEGARIDVAMLEALAEWMGNPMYYTYGGGAPAPRTGAFHPSVVPYGPFSAGDGAVVMMGLQNEREWVVFCREVLESPEIAADPRFGNNTLRTENRDALEAIILAAFARMSAVEVQEKLDRAGLATANVNTPANLWDHPQLVHRKRWVEVDSPVGAVPALLPPGSSDRYRPRMDAIPALGEQTDAILNELGFDAGEIAGLHAAGAV